MSDSNEYSFREEIDERVENLVGVINFLPGIRTNISCGGHREITHESQCKEDEFYVQFSVYPERGGMLSLGIITIAANNTSEENLCVHTVVYEHPQNLFYQVTGKNGIDPDGLESQLFLCMLKYKEEFNSLKSSSSIEEDED